MRCRRACDRPADAGRPGRPNGGTDRLGHLAVRHGPAGCPLRTTDHHDRPSWPAHRRTDCSAPASHRPVRRKAHRSSVARSLLLARPRTVAKHPAPYYHLGCRRRRSSRRDSPPRCVEGRARRPTSAGTIAPVRWWSTGPSPDCGIRATSHPAARDWSTESPGPVGPTRPICFDRTRCSIGLPLASAGEPKTSRTGPDRCCSTHLRGVPNRSRTPGWPTAQVLARRLAPTRTNSAATATTRCLARSIFVASWTDRWRNCDSSRSSAPTSHCCSNRD